MTPRAHDRFADPAFDDHDWRPADVLGDMGMAPWGMLVNDDSGELPPRAVRLGLEEPETRTLTAVEADERLEDEWIYQAEGKPFAQRSKDEIGWAQELADSDYDDMDPIYLPDGGVAFMTTRGNSYARCVELNSRLGQAGLQMPDAPH